MKITADYHNHTYFSHGVGSIEENVAIAISRGLKTIAISDHGPGVQIYGFGIDKKDYKVMRDEVDRLKELYHGTIEILLGLEANIMDSKGNLDVDDEILRYNDILLASYHFDIAHEDYLSEIRSRMRGRNKLKHMIDASLYEEIINNNTTGMINAINKYNINIITHPGDNFPILLSKVAPIAGARGTALEINNFHTCLDEKGVKEAMAFPEVKFVVNSDAHRPADVGHFPAALKIVKKAGLDVDRIINAEKEI